MLNLMRKHAKSWIINVMVAAIVVVFIFWGAGSFRQRKMTRVATVNGDTISVAQYQEKYRQLFEMAKAQYRDYLDEKLLEALNLKRQALEGLINQRLIYQQARGLGLEVTAEELQQKIAQTEVFHVDGRFNRGRYTAILARSHYTPKQYEEVLAQEMLTQKVTQLVTGLAKVSPAEARDYFHLTKDKVDLEFVLFPAEKYRKKARPTQKEIEAYFKKNRENYRVPVQVKAAYLAFRPKDMEGKVTAGDDEMKDYYEINLDKYREPEKVKARHILFRLEPQAKPADVDKVRGKAEAVLKLAQQGRDFAKLAKKYSQGPTAKVGGNLDWFAREQMVKPFADAAFKLKKGQVSDLVRTDFGFHIIKLDDRRAAGSRSFEEAREDVRKKIIKEKTTELAADQATEAYEEISLSQDFEGVAKKMGLKLTITGLFSAKRPPTEAGLDLKFSEVALTLKKGEIGPLIDLDDGHYLIKCLERKKAYLPQLEEVRAGVKADLSGEQALNLAGRAAEDFLAKVKKGENWEKAARAAKVEPKSTGLFTRHELAPKIGANEPLKKAAFSLRGPDQVAPQAYKGERGYYVIRLKQRRTAVDEEFAKEKELLMKRLLAGKGQTYLYQWLESLKAKSDIKIEEGMI